MDGHSNAKLQSSCWESFFFFSPLFLEVGTALQSNTCWDINKYKWKKGPFSICGTRISFTLVTLTSKLMSGINAGHQAKCQRRNLLCVIVCLSVADCTLVTQFDFGKSQITRFAFRFKLLFPWRHLTECKKLSKRLNELRKNIVCKGCLFYFHSLFHPDCDCYKARQQ